MFTDKLIKYFKRKHPEQASFRNALGNFSGKIGLISNLCLFLVKFLIGYFSSSVSIMADAINNLSDTASSVLTLVGFHFAKKPADNEHPFGHERFEYISGLFISLLVIVVGVQFLISAIQKIFNPASTLVSTVMLVVLLASVVIKLIQSSFYRAFGKSMDSNTLLALAQDSFNDVLVTSAVIAGSVIERLSGWRIDGYLALIISVYIVISGIKMILGSMDDLMGKRPSQTLVDQAKAILDRYPILLGYHDLIIHQYGLDHVFASVDVELDTSMSLMKCHDIIESIENDFKKECGIRLSIHLDPINIHDQHYLELFDAVEGIVLGLNLGLDLHDFRITREQREVAVNFDCVVPEDCPLGKDELDQTIKRLIKEKCDVNIVHIDFDYHYILNQTTKVE